MRRDYTNSDRAYAIRVLTNSGGNAAEAARQTGFPRRTIVYWATQTGVRGMVVSTDQSESVSSREKGEEGADGGAIGSTGGKQNVPVRRKGTENDRLEAIAGWCRARDLNLAQLGDPEKVRKASLKENIWAAGTSQDKLNILTGRPSAITETRVARYVEGDSLRAVASFVIDVPALPAGRKDLARAGRVTENDAHRRAVPALPTMSGRKSTSVQPIGNGIVREAGTP